MKVIKRDGRAVDFDRSKIEIAIEKANKEVKEKERATPEEIKKIINYVIELDRKRILVEDIQDIIEEQLMDMKHFELAKKYMIYRYTRALVRKSNSTDQSILGLIKNQNKESGGDNQNRGINIASTQRDLIAGEVSKDLTNRILLPEKISKAHEDGIIHFHDSSYFLQPLINSSLINLEDMLDNKTVMNGKRIESPKSFQVACNVATQIMATVSSSQYGGQSVNVSCLGKYLKKSYDKINREITEEVGNEVDNKIKEKLIKRRIGSELASGVQTIKYQINTLMTTNGHSPFVTLFLYLNEAEFLNENAQIIEEILKQSMEGFKDENDNIINSKFPKLVYVIDDYNNLSGGKYDYLTKLAIECSLKGANIAFLSAKLMRKYYQGNVFSPMASRCFLLPYKVDGKYKFDGRFNQGIVSINLPQIALLADGNEKVFWEELDERLKTCYEALMCRHYALLGTISDISPIHWKYGAASRLSSGERIDELLKGGYSTLSLGYIGLYETTMLMTHSSQLEGAGHEFAIKLLKKIRETVDSWKKETGIGFTLYATPAESICYRFASIDKEEYGMIKDVTDKGYYTNSYHLDYREKVDPYQKMRVEGEFQAITNGGGISYIKIPDDKIETIEELVKYAYENIMYVEFIKDDTNESLCDVDMEKEP